jgi:hypothetical protein
VAVGPLGVTVETGRAWLLRRLAAPSQVWSQPNCDNSGSNASHRQSHLPTFEDVKPIVIVFESPQIKDRQLRGSELLPNELRNLDFNRLDRLTDLGGKLSRQLFQSANLWTRNSKSGTVAADVGRLISGETARSHTTKGLARPMVSSF